MRGGSAWNIEGRATLGKKRRDWLPNRAEELTEVINWSITSSSSGWKVETSFECQRVVVQG